MALTRPDHYPQLDALRALAVSAVACHHWVPAIPPTLQLGASVQLFFVLSGFLITGILLDAKSQARAAGGGLRTVLLMFYIRRSLRIFPLYYLVLLAAVVANIPPVRESWPWHFAYATNYYCVHTGTWPGALSHFWSLAVEEQFYLVWPLVVLFVPDRRLSLVFAAFIVTGPLFRWFGDHTGLNAEQKWYLATPGSFDSLGLGALLAYYRRHDLPGWAARIRWSSPWTAVILLGAFVPIAFSSAGWTHFGFLSLTIASGVFACVINAAVNRIPGPAGRMLEWRPLVYLGTISYGVYVLHNFSFSLWVKMTRHFPGLPRGQAAWLVFAALTTVAGAMALWHGFERPINRQKRRFPYVDSAQPMKPAGP
jgi:peptidoglycan/LPS O-acetylase OafA/YrhL